MKENRRNFLRTAGAALVAASVPLAITAQKGDARPSPTNNLKQMIIFGGISEPNPTLPPGVFSQAFFQFQMQAEFGVGGHAVISDAIFTDINSHIRIHSAGRTDINDIYIFQGTVERSISPDMVGKPVAIKVQVVDGNDNCNVTLTIGDTPLQGLLLPAVQKIRVPIYG